MAVIKHINTPIFGPNLKDPIKRNTDDARAESAFRQWESQYSQKDAKYRVCELVKEFGRVADFQAIRTVIDVHDRETRIGTDAPLA